MAENDQEKTEHLSQKKLEESRHKGELPRSQELTTFIVFAIFLTYFGVTRLQWLEGLGAIMEDFLVFDQHLKLTADTLGEFLLMPILRAALLMAPLFAIILVISPVASMAQTQFNIAREKFQPNWEKMNPISGLKRMVSLRQWIEGLKSCIKIAMCSFLAWESLVESVPRLRLLGRQDLVSQLNTMLDVALTIGIRIAILMAVLAVFDYGYQWWEFIKKLRMTHQELKDEIKEREGNPLIKQRQRQIQMERARQRMMADVAKANVVVTNPTHYAVALTYNKDKAPAPYVCAKGTQYLALKIREIAKEHKIPIIENKPLARGLYRHVKVGQIIPPEFYKTVAEVLAFVFMLNRKKKANSYAARNLPR